VRKGDEGGKYFIEAVRLESSTGLEYRGEMDVEEG